MLYLLADYLGFPGILNLIRYLSFRTGGAVATALFLGLLIGPRFIAWLRIKQGKGQPIREDGPQSHLAKRGTPTMGGLMILTALGVSVLLWMDLTNPYVWACLAVTFGFGLIGFLDDLDKVRKASHKGVSGRARLIAEFVIAGAAAALITQYNGTELYLPFFSFRLDLGPAYIVFAAFTIVAFGNAVNLTDGLDGLATMPVIIASVAFMLIVYLVGNAKYAEYLGIPYVEGAGDLAIFCGAIVGAGTVLNEADLHAALEAGAEFIVSPGLTEPLARAAASSGVPFLPGVANAGDIMRGLDLGLDRFKFFPAVASGGLPALRALSGPFGKVAFCPTGGIGEVDVATWLAEPSVACVGGSWIVPRGAPDLSEIRANAERAARLGH